MKITKNLLKLLLLISLPVLLSACGDDSSGGGSPGSASYNLNLNIGDGQQQLYFAGSDGVRIKVSPSFYKSEHHDITTGVALADVFAMIDKGGKFSNVDCPDPIKPNSAPCYFKFKPDAFTETVGVMVSGTYYKYNSSEALPDMSTTSFIIDPNQVAQLRGSDIAAQPLYSVGIMGAHLAQNESGGQYGSILSDYQQSAQPMSGDNELQWRDFDHLTTAQFIVNAASTNHDLALFGSTHKNGKLDSSTPKLFFNPINVSAPSSGSGTYNCLAVFHGTDDPTFMTIGDGYALPSGAPTNSAPLHLTFIPFESQPDKTCADNAPAANYDAKDVLAVWVSAKHEDASKNPHTVESEVGVQHAAADPASCEITNTKDKYESLIANSGAGICNGMLKPPHWEVVSPQGISGSSYLQFVGPLYDYMSQHPTQDINIKTDADADVQYPLSSEYVRFPQEISDVTQCTNAVDTYNNKLYQALSNPSEYQTVVSSDFGSVATSCGLLGQPIDFKDEDGYLRSYTYSPVYSGKITLSGFGRINGQHAIDLYAQPLEGTNGSHTSVANYACLANAISNMGSIFTCKYPQTSTSWGYDTTNYPGTADFTPWAQFAQWRILTSLLGLNADNKGEINVSGISVVNTPKRNRGTVQLNVAQFGPPEIGDGDSSNGTVNMLDVKQVGSWMDATDGPDIGSDNASMQYSYYQINDDSVKVEAQKQKYNHATVLQADVGGIMLGMYGVVRDGINNSDISDISFPRITQGYDSPTAMSDSDWNPYSSTNGVISTRTCPREFQVNETPYGMGGVNVSDVRVFGLGTDAATAGSNEPNSIVAMAALGVAGDSKFCGQAFDRGYEVSSNESYYFGPFTITGARSDVTPVSVSSQNPALALLYNVLSSNNPENQTKYVIMPASGTPLVSIKWWQQGSEDNSINNKLGAVNFCTPEGDNKNTCLTDGSGKNLTLANATTVAASDGDLYFACGLSGGLCYKFLSSGSVQEYTSATASTNVIYYPVGDAAFSNSILYPYTAAN